MQPRCIHCAAPVLEDLEYCKRCANLVGAKKKELTEWIDIQNLVKEREANREPRAHLYARVSSIGQATEGVSLDAQIGTLLRWFQEVREEKGWAESPEVYIEDGKSAFHYNILRREKGKEMAQNLAAGDTIVIWSVERGFRNAADFHNSKESLKRMGINLVIYQLKDLTEGPMADIIQTIFAGLAQLDSSIKSERNRAASNRLIDTGQYPYRSATFKRVKRGKQKILVPRTEEVGRVMKMLFSWWCEGLGQDACFDRLEVVLAKEEGRIPLGRYDLDEDGNKRRWSLKKTLGALYDYRMLALPRNHQHAIPIPRPGQTVKWSNKNWGPSNPLTERGKRLKKNTQMALKEGAKARRKARLAKS